MNIINEKRAEILSNNNDGQETLENYLKGIETVNLQELTINTELYGKLDLSFMNTRKFKYIRNLTFTEGKITDLINVPSYIQKLVCAKNLLVELENLPSSLLYLDFSENYLKTIDLSKQKYLEIVHGENNKLTSIQLDPDNLKELHLQGNDLRELDVKDMRELDVLNVSNNSLLIVKNWDNIDLKSYSHDNNSLTQISTAIMTSKTSEEVEESIELMDYSVALKRYFTMKANYEEKKMQSKRKAMKNNTKPQEKCIKCNKNVGTIFSNKDGMYSAICGSKIDPCGLDIKLYRGDFESTENILTAMESIIEEDKKDIIIQKLDSIFNYKTNEESVAKFKEIMETYNSDNESYLSLLKDYNNIFNNEERLLKIRKKQMKIYKINQDLENMMNEYKETNNKEIIKNAMSLYVKDLMPEMSNLQNLKYEASEMEEIKNGKGEPIYKLHQYENHISSKYQVWNSAPKVKTFKI